MNQRIIMHIDFDYFYAQCEEIRDPSIKDKPVVVCVYSARGNDSGVISTANYHARKYGVKSGMPIKLAKKLLPNDAIFLPLDSEYYSYSKISEKAMSIIKKYANKFELVGDDEAFIDVSNKVSNMESAKELALRIKEEVKREIGLSISIGISINKLIAKIASSYNKPDGLTIVEAEKVQEFIDDMDVDAIIGIGKKTKERLNELGIRKVGELRGLDVYTLIKEFGKKNGIYLYNAARGIDEEDVKETYITQFSKISTLKKDTNNVEDMLEELRLLTSEVYEIAKNNGYSFKSVGIILVLGDLTIRSKNKTLKTLCNNKEELFKITRKLLIDAMRDKPIVRRLGVKVSDLIDNKGQETLLRFMC